METALISMMGALLAMMAGVMAVMAGVLLKMVDLSRRVGRLEAMLETWLRHTHDRDTGQPIAAAAAAMPVDGD